MTRFWVIAFTVLLGWQADAQVPSLTAGFGDRLKRATGAGARTSATGQFVLYEAPAAGRPLQLDNSHTNHVLVDAPLLAVMCERIKTALLKELAAPDQWRGRIAIHIHRATSMDEQMVVASARTGDNWMYSVEVPDVTERTRLASAIVGVLLLEAANRDAGRSAEIPAWLIQGLTRELMLTTATPLLLDRPQRYGRDQVQTFLAIIGIRSDELTRAHAELQTRAPLTLEELSWPENGQDETEIYRNSAQFFVHELLRLDQGRASMLALVKGLARHYNWQTSFLEAFQNNFPGQLEVEKWWALKLANFTGRDLTRTWPAAESWNKLDELLRASVQVRTSPDELPLNTEVSLQTIIRDWDYPQQRELLKTRVQQLFLFRNWVSQDLVRTVDDYRQTLNSYMLRREQSTTLSKTQALVGLDRVAQETLDQLDALDARRQQLRPAPAADPVAVSAVDR